jgi:hypothetical protein
LLNHFPESGHNAMSVSELALDWLDLLSEEGVTQAQFSAGVRHAVKTCSFFPKVADVLKGVKIYRETQPALKNGQMQLASTTSNHELTQEEINRNKERIKMIKLVFHPDPEKRVTVEEATAFIEDKIHIKEFGSA